MEDLGFLCSIGPSLVPIIDLKTDKHTEDDDQRLDEDGEPVIALVRRRRIMV